MSSFKTPKGTELPLTDIKGEQYLKVQHRLVWFREEHPLDLCIETQVKEQSPEFALAKATIKDKEGHVLSTGHKTESQRDFHDYMEKAETGAIGRALAFLGYGTAHAKELEEYDDGVKKVVDAPVNQAPGPKPKPATSRAKIINKNSAYCCGSLMMDSKYNNDELYCLTCKKKKYKADILDYPPEQKK